MATGWDGYGGSSGNTEIRGGYGFQPSDAYGRSSDIRGGYGHHGASSGGYGAPSGEPNIRGGYGHQSGGFDIPSAEPEIRGGYGYHGAPGGDRRSDHANYRAGSGRQYNVHGSSPFATAYNTPAMEAEDDRYDSRESSARRRGGFDDESRPVGSGDGNRYRRDDRQNDDYGRGYGNAARDEGNVRGRSDDRYGRGRQDDGFTGRNDGYGRSNGTRGTGSDYNRPDRHDAVHPHRADDPYAQPSHRNGDYRRGGGSGGYGDRGDYDDGGGYGDRRSGRRDSGGRRSDPNDRGGRGPGGGYDDYGDSYGQPRRDRHREGFQERSPRAQRGTDALSSELERHHTDLRPDSAAERQQKERDAAGRAEANKLRKSLEGVKKHIQVSNEKLREVRARLSEFSSARVQVKELKKRLKDARAELADLEMQRATTPPLDEPPPPDQYGGHRGHVSGRGRGRGRGGGRGGRGNHGRGGGRDMASGWDGYGGSEGVRPPSSSSRRGGGSTPRSTGTGSTKARRGRKKNALKKLNSLRKERANTPRGHASTPRSSAPRGRDSYAKQNLQLNIDGSERNFGADAFSEAATPRAVGGRQGHAPREDSATPRSSAPRREAAPRGGGASRRVAARPPSSSSRRTPRQPSPREAPTLSTSADPPAYAPPGALAPCRFCGRKFNPDRLAKHQSICDPSKKKSRKVFDSTRKRAEAIVELSGGNRSDVRKMTKNAKKAKAQKARGGSGRGGGKGAKWRAQSNQLREAMRAQREYVKAKKEGRAPPPVAASAPDPNLVPCPHCGRTFAPKTAERHIPKCKNIRAKPSRLTAGSGNRRRNQTMNRRRRY